MRSRANDDHDRERERYRLAATVALEQLEWAVGYLHRLRKSEIASALDRNRKQIAKRLH
jgi:hypothetical protein